MFSILQDNSCVLNKIPDSTKLTNHMSEISNQQREVVSLPLVFSRLQVTLLFFFGSSCDKAT